MASLIAAMEGPIATGADLAGLTARPYASIAAGTAARRNSLAGAEAGDLGAARNLGRGTGNLGYENGMTTLTALPSLIAD